MARTAFSFGRFTIGTGALVHNTRAVVVEKVIAGPAAGTPRHLVLSTGGADHSVAIRTRALVGFAGECRCQMHTRGTAGTLRGTVGRTGVVASAHAVGTCAFLPDTLRDLRDFLEVTRLAAEALGVLVLHTRTVLSSHSRDTKLTFAYILEALDGRCGVWWVPESSVALSADLGPMLGTVRALRRRAI